MAKKGEPIPAGFHSLTPHLVVPGAAKYIDFLKRAFNAIEVSQSPGPGGKLMHAQVNIGDSPLMFADDFAEEFKMPPLAQGRMPYVIHLYVADSDATYKQAIAAGAKATMPLGDAFWGDRYGQLQDPFGVTWAIATHQWDLTPAEIAERQAKAFGAGHP